MGGESDFFGLVRKKDSLLNKSNEDAIFEIGSILKVFNAILMANAIQDAKITIDQPISTMIPYPLHSDQPITFRQLANHSSGLPGLPENLFPLMDKSPDNPYCVYGDAEMRYCLENQIKTTGRPGEKSSYSN